MGIIKITKKQLDTAFDNSASIFLGVVHSFPDEQKCISTIQQIKQGVPMTEIRHSKVHPTYIEFSDGSRVLTTTQGNSKYAFYQLDGTKMYFVHLTSRADASYSKVMCYFVL